MFTKFHRSLRSHGRLILTFALALTLFGAAERTGLTAPPANDLRSGATLVTVGFSESLDTSEATTDAEDAIMNSRCGFPATDASVWYQFVGTGEKISLNVFQSGFSAGVVAVNDLNDPTHAACGWGGVDFVAFAGETYYILAFDDQSDGVGTGGMLNISISAAQPPPDLTVTLSVERFGTVNARTGVATISGTYSCVNADLLNVSVSAYQEVGPFFGFGNFDFQVEATCDGVPRSWSADVYPLDPPGRKFLGGRALTSASAYSFGPHGYGDFVSSEQTIILRGKE